jgi:hypothetical protein
VSPRGTAITRGQRGLVAALALASCGSIAGAQGQRSTTVFPVQALSFGLLLPGVPEVVPVTDMARRAMVALSGAGAVDVTLVLPSSLSAPDGTNIPLQFRAGDAGLLQSAGSAVVPLNPYQVNRVHLAPDRMVYLLLGGVALPSQAQHPGHYSARVLVIVSQPGT